MNQPKQTHLRRILMAGAVAASTVIAAALPALAEETPDPPIATVNGQAITEADLAAAAAEFGDQLARVPPENRETALIDLIVNIKLAAQAAEAAGLDKNPVVMKRIELGRMRALYSEFLRQKFLAAVTDATIKQRYDEEIAKFEPGDEVKASHILVPTEEEAKAIIADLDKGGDFAAIAKEKSQDPGSGASGGDLGYFTKGRMVKPFEDAAFALEVGKYTPTPVKSDFGFHVILVVDKRKEEAPKFETEAQRIQQDLIRETFEKEIKTLRDAAKIEVIPPAAPPADAATPPAPETPKSE